MEKLKTFFWFHKDADYLSDSLLAVMRTPNGAEYMKTKDINKLFDKRNYTVKAISQNMLYKHNNSTFNLLLKFVENIHKFGYTVTKDEYIRNKRLDIMKAIQIIEKYRILYINKQQKLDFSMDFESMRLD